MNRDAEPDHFSKDQTSLMRSLPFTDRADAGRQLARALETYRDEAPIVLGLPQGGVIIASEVARALDAPLDAIVARKVGAPFDPEFAVGAVAPGVVLVEEVEGLSREALRQSVSQAQDEMEQRIRQYRGTEGMPRLQGRTVILVDDGLATGLTARAAVRALRKQHPRRLVLAVPVGPVQGVERIEAEVDHLVCLIRPRQFFAVGQWYEHFEPVADEEVIACLRQAHGETAEGRE